MWTWLQVFLALIVIQQILDQCGTLLDQRQQVTGRQAGTGKHSSTSSNN